MSDLVDFVTEGRSGGRSPERSPGVTKSTRYEKINRDLQTVWQTSRGSLVPGFSAQIGGHFAAGSHVILAALASFCHASFFARILTKCRSQTVSGTVPNKNCHSELDGDTNGETVVLDTVSAPFIILDYHDFN